MGKCSQMVITWDMFVAAIDCILFLITIPCVYRIAQHGHTGPKSFYYLSLALGVSTLIGLSANCIKQIYTCFDPNIEKTSSMISVAFYGIGFYLLLLLLFIRVDSVTKDTMFAVSKTTSRIYYGMCCLIPIFSVFILILRAINDPIHLIFGAMVLFMIIIIIISIVYLFI